MRLILFDMKNYISALFRIILFKCCQPHKKCFQEPYLRFTLVDTIGKDTYVKILIARMEQRRDTGA